MKTIEWLKRAGEEQPAKLSTEERAAKVALLSILFKAPDSGARQELIKMIVSKPITTEWDVYPRNWHYCPNCLKTYKPICRAECPCSQAQATYGICSCGAVNADYNTCSGHGVALCYINGELLITTDNLMSKCYWADRLSGYVGVQSRVKWLRNKNCQTSSPWAEFGEECIVDNLPIID